MADEKIKANEVLDDTELDKVAGGFSDETYEDIETLKRTCGIDCTIGGDYNTAVKFLRDNYANAGVDIRVHDHGPNEYFDINTGRKLSHAEAMEAFARAGRNLHRW